MSFGGDRRAQQIAIPLVGFAAAIAALVLMVIMTDPLVQDVHQFALNETTNATVKKGINQRKTVWNNIVWVGMSVLTVTLVMAGVYTGRL